MTKLNIDGKLVHSIAKNTFGEKKSYTRDEYAYVLKMLVPSSYVLKHHKVKGGPITFQISNHNRQYAFHHRPWQVSILNDQHPDKVVIKARQLGLSEIGVAEMLHFADTHSFDAVKCMYTFPTVNQMEQFVSTRFDPVLKEDYYASLLDPNHDSYKKKKIRDSFLFFRSSSKASAVEGVDIDFLALDE
jgi:hypothetical protein